MNFSIVQQPNRKKKLKELIALKKVYQKEILKLLEEVKYFEMEGKVRRAFVFGLFCMIRNGAINLIYGAYKMLVKHAGKKEPVFPDSHKDIINAFKEILIYRCCMMDRAFWEVQIRKWKNNKKLQTKELDIERDLYMTDISKGVFTGFRRFCQLLDEESDVMNREFLKSYDKRMCEYASAQDIFAAKEPKGTFLWEAGKNIATAMVGSPHIAIVELVVMTGMEQLVNDRDFIAKYFNVIIEEIGEER